MVLIKACIVIPKIRLLTKIKKDEFCICGGFANKKHKCGPFFLMRVGSAKQKINITWPYMLTIQYSHHIIGMNFRYVAAWNADVSYFSYSYYNYPHCLLLFEWFLVMVCVLSEVAFTISESSSASVISCPAASPACFTIFRETTFNSVTTPRKSFKISFLS